MRSIHYDYHDLYRLKREHVIEDDGNEPVTTLDVRYHYDKVSNRLAMVREERCEVEVYRHTTTYQYDDNDRLTGSTTETDAVNLAAQDKLDRYYAGRPRLWTRWFALSFVGLTLAAFWAPLFVPSRRRLGVRARRNGFLSACVATFLVPLMAVNPSTVDAAFTEAMQVQAVLAAGVPLGCTAQELATVTTTYTYDDNGNQISRTRTDAQGSATDTYTFDYQNRLAGAITNIDTAPTHVAYEYDADGIRIAKTVAGSRVRHVVDKNQAYAQVVEERAPDTGEVIVRYTYGDDLISQHRPDGAVTRYYHYDGQMSTRQLTDGATGAAVTVKDRYGYDAFGVGLREEGPSDNAYRYTGEQYDVATGSYYLRARYYDAMIGRFVSADSFAGNTQDPTSLHKYIYANGNPSNAWDPTGNWTIFHTLAVNFLVNILASILIGVHNKFIHGGSFAPDALVFGAQYVGTIKGPRALELLAAGIQTASTLLFPQTALARGMAALREAFATTQFNSEFGVGFTVGFEILLHAITGENALFWFVGGASSFGPGASGHAISAYRAVVWNLPSAQQYKGPFTSFSGTAGKGGVFGLSKGMYFGGDGVRAWFQGFTLAQGGTRTSVGLSITHYFPIEILSGFDKSWLLFAPTPWNVLLYLKSQNRLG